MRVEEHTIDLAGSPVFLRRAPAPGGADPQARALPRYVHGIPTSSAVWSELLERTGGTAVDLLGFGRSGKGGHLDISLAGHADFLEAVLEALEIERVALVLHGWGAAGGLIFAQRHPHRVQRLVLIDALPLLPGFRWTRLPRLVRRPVLGELAMGALSQRTLTRLLRRGSGAVEPWNPERLAAVWRDFDQGTQRAVLRLLRDGSEERLAQAGAQLGTLQMPALVLWGAQDPWLAPEYGEAYTQTLPDAELVMLPDAGHWPWLEDQAAAARIIAFLQQQPA